MNPDTANLYASILKVEKPDVGTRLVHARISDETKDLDGQVADYGWLKQALPDWFQFGNVRDMHQPNVVGKATELTAVPEAKGFDGVLKVVDPLAIRKLDEELYGGVSIGIKSPRVINEKGAVISPHLPGRIVGGKIVEVSLVDHPANENCKLVLAKSATGNRGTLALLAEPEEINKATDQADLTKDSTIPVLTGVEKAHNKPANAALSAIKTLISQELAEPEAEFDCIHWLSSIGESLIGWMKSENDEMSMGADPELVKATLDDFVQVAQEPDIAKRRQFYDREHRAAIQQALQNLSTLVQRDMQGPDTDPTSVDAPEHQEAELRDGAGRMREPTSVAQAGPSLEGGHRSQPDNPMAPGYELRNTATRVSISDVPTQRGPSGVAQAGNDLAGAPRAGGANAAVGMGAEPDLTKSAVAPDLDKAAIADAVKAIFPELVKEFREALKDELVGEFAPKTLVADVEKLGKRAQPNNGPMLGSGIRALEKTFAANATVNADTVPQEHLDKMVRLSELAKSDDVETASSARALLKKMASQYFQPGA